MRTVAIIQARMGSTRLPGKVLFDLEGKTVLERVIERVRAGKKVEKIVVATTVSKEDLVLVKLCAEKGISVFCGSEDDVLDRYYHAARLFNADHVIRITSDCPLIDPKIIDDVVKHYFDEEADYASNCITETYPDGEDVEIFSFEVLEKAWKEAGLTSEREHVTPYIRKNKNKFKLVGVEYQIDLSKKRWTLDNQEDYSFIKNLYSALLEKDELFGMEEIFAYLEKSVSLEKLNHHIRRNEGYAKSLREDSSIAAGMEDLNVQKIDN